MSVEAGGWRYKTVLERAEQRVADCSIELHEAQVTLKALEEYYAQEPEDN